MNFPKISVIIPAYNRASFLPDALESVLTQTYQDFEIIVIDDGSIDNTKEVIDTYTKKFPDKIKYFYQENKGLPAARNAGIRQSRAEYIALLDSDDKWMPNNLEVLFKELKDSPEFHVVYSTVNMVDLKDNFLRIKPVLRPGNTFDGILYNMSHLPPSSIILKKDVFDKVGLFDEQMQAAEDIDMWVRVSAYFKVKRVETPLAMCRVHGNNLSSNEMKMSQGYIIYWKKILQNRQLYKGIPKGFLKLKVARSYYMLSRCYMKTKEHKKALWNNLLALLYSPVCGIGFITKDDPLSQRLKKMINPYFALMYNIFKYVFTLR